MIEVENILNTGFENIGLNTPVYVEIADEQQQLPYIVYEVENNYQSTKFGIFGNIANTVISVYTEKYLQGLDIRKTITDYFKLNNRLVNGDNEISITLLSDDTKYNGDCYLSTITYTIIIN